MQLDTQRFRKRFFKAVRAFKPMARRGRLTLKLSGDTQTQTVESYFNGPDDVEAVRFAVVMRTFMDPASPYHYSHIWAQVQDASPAGLSDVQPAAERYIRRIEAGGFAIILNGQRLSAKDLYAYVADGGYFKDEATATKRLHEILSIPLVAPAVRFHFFSFILDVFHLLEDLLPYIMQIERDHRAKTPPEAPRACLFCRSTAGPFNSEEHILPESLGNDDHVLPRGYVCDTCNHTLSKVEQALVEYPPIALLRVTYVQHDKYGHLPTATFKGATWKRTAPRRIEIHSTEEGGFRVDGNEVTANVVGTKRFEPHPIARAVMKIALEIVAKDEGYEAAMDPKYDRARAFIIGTDETFSGVLVMPLKLTPESGIDVTIFARAPHTLVRVNIFGIHFGITLEPMKRRAEPVTLTIKNAPPLQMWDLGEPPARRDRASRRKADAAARRPVR